MVRGTERGDRGKVITIDQPSLQLAGRRRVQLAAALAVDVAAFGLAVAALGGGMLSAIAPVIGTILTGIALTLNLTSWVAARGVWSGDGDPSALRGLALRSLWPSTPVLLVSLGVILGVALPPIIRIFSSSHSLGNATWTDGVALGSLVLYLIASAGAALLPLRVRR